MIYRLVAVYSQKRLTPKVTVFCFWLLQLINVSDKAAKVIKKVFIRIFPVKSYYRFYLTLRLCFLKSNLLAQHFTGLSGEPQIIVSFQIIIDTFKSDTQFFF